MGIAMANDWAAVDDLMRELGSVRQAASSMRAEDVAQAAVDRAIAEAAEAVNQTIDAPLDPKRLVAARDAVGVAEEVILALDREIGRSLRVRARAQALCDRAADLIRQSTERERIRFELASRPFGERRIVEALSPLALSGFTVTVHPPPADSVDLGLVVEVSKMGKAATSFRVRTDAPSHEWDAAVRKELLRRP
jgi:hypothetical protein